MLLIRETSKHNNLFGPPIGLSLQEAVPVLDRLPKEPAFLNLQILPLLEQARGRESWYVARRHEALDGSYSLQIFVWPPGSRTRIHDHSSWEPSAVRSEPCWKSATSARTTVYSKVTRV